MRTLALRAILPLAVFAACGTEPDRAPAMSDGLQADLQRAASGSVELAAASSADRAVVSAIESTPARSPSPDASPRRSRTPRTPIPRATPDAAPEPAPAPAPAASVEESEIVAEAPTSSDLPVATRPVPVSFPAGGSTGTGGGPGGDAGSGGSGRGPIGVVIRGGGTGEDHCEIHDRRRRGGSGPVVIISFPGRSGGIGTPTFPGSPGLPRF